MGDIVRFSLIVCTINRKDEVTQLFDSITHQSRSDCEVILVDQNQDDRLVEICDRFAGNFPIKHIRISGTGSSRARNVGLGYATGELIGFPDDDCSYLDGYLDVVDSIFNSEPAIDCISGSPTANRMDVIGNWREGRRELDAVSVLSRCIEFTIFIRSHCLKRVRFNECLGVGAQTLWGSEEGTDFLIRLIHGGCRVVQFPQLRVYHPNKIVKITVASLALTASYSRGRGCLFRLHRFPLRMVARTLFRSSMGICVYLVSLDVMRSLYYVVVVRGVIRGLMMSKAELTAVRKSIAYQTDAAEHRSGPPVTSTPLSDYNLMRSEPENS